MTVLWEPGYIRLAKHRRRTSVRSRRGAKLQRERGDGNGVRLLLRFRWLYLIDLVFLLSRVPNGKGQLEGERLCERGTQAMYETLLQMQRRSWTSWLYVAVDRKSRKSD